MSSITQSFLNSFSELETLISKAAKKSKSDSVVKNYNVLCDKKSFFRKYKIDMQQLSGLRNVLVHERINKTEYLAEPLPSVLFKLEKLIGLFNKPKLVINHFKSEVKEVLSTELMTDLLSYLGDKDYSQALVRTNSDLNVLSANTIQRWLAKHAKDEILELNVPVADVMNYQEGCTEIELESKSLTLIDALDYFQVNTQLVILVITENGKKNEKVISLLTTYDLPKIYEILES